MKIVIAFSLFLVACSTNDPPTSVRQAILGGTRDQADPAVVFLLGSSNGANTENCTAFVVSSHVLLTAAHCVSPDIVGAQPTFKLFLGDDHLDPQQTALPANFVDVTDTAFDPGFESNNGAAGHDIGAMAVVDALPMTPLPLSHEALDASAVGQPLRLIGYGETDASQETSTDVKYQVTTTLGAVDDEHVVDMDPTHTFCFGDSGGPELLTRDGAEVVVGVVSLRHRAVGEPTCGGVGYGTRVDAYTSFIDPFVLAHEPAVVDAATADADAEVPKGGGCAIAAGTTPGSWPVALLVGLVAYAASQRTSRRGSRSRPSYTTDADVRRASFDGDARRARLRHISNADPVLNDRRLPRLVT